jgi:hypothetical protein
VNDALETDMAVKALARRLQDWGIKEPFPKARSYMDDLLARGWRSGHIRVPRNPQPHEECAHHQGQFRLSCSGCAADRKAAREEAGAQQQEEARTREPPPSYAKPSRRGHEPGRRVGIRRRTHE